MLIPVKSEGEKLVIIHNLSILLDFHHKYVVDEELMRYNMTGYPSGYDTREVIVLSIVVVFIMSTIIIGNLLVIVAIFSEYTLQCVQNWFVASLAVSDLMLGILVMPFSLSQEVVGYWLFGDFWCQVSCFFNIFIICTSLVNFKSRLFLSSQRLKMNPNFKGVFGYSSVTNRSLLRISIHDGNCLKIY